MNQFKTLYAELEALTQIENSAFYFKDEICPWDSRLYRTFLYRLASWTDFKLPSAIESRGIMFRKESDDWVLVSRPFQKFHNRTEGSIEERRSDKDIIRLENKFDGSLIKTYIDANGELRFASKGSLTSFAAIAAQEIFNEYDDQVKRIYKAFVRSGFTLLFEYISPDNHIVIRYPRKELKLLAIRHLSGSYVNYIPKDSITITSDHNIDQMIQDCYDSRESDFEGYVAVFSDGFRFKIKSNKYCELHHLKDSINNKSRLFDVCLNDYVDDLIASFSEDQSIVEYISIMDDLVKKHYRKYLNTIEDVYNQNKDLSRKDFAILCQSAYQIQFPILMARYIGKEIDEKKIFKKYLEDYILSEFDSLTSLEMNQLDIEEE